MNKKVKRICQYCGKEFFAYISAIRRGRGMFCSLSCSGKERYKNTLKPRKNTGEDNPNWKGGISKDNYRYRKIQKERYPEHVIARMIAKSAIRTGKLIRGSCEVCGETNVDAHHDDYSKPLDVRWLCKKHHREIHGGMRFNAHKEISDGLCAVSRPRK